MCLTLWVHYKEAKKEYKLIVGELKERLPEMFDTIPEADVEVEMYEDPNKPSVYNSGSIDGSIKPKIKFYLSGIHITKSLKTTVYHEAIPGHHFQFALEMKNKDIPDFKKIMPFGGYTEGWASYAEILPMEYGFVDNPKDKLQLLYSDLTSAVNTAIDTGIHYKRWTKSETEEYIKKHRNPKTQVSYDFFINNPCDQIKYFVGLVKMRELRKRAEEQLGEKFNIKEFHRVILKNGRMPLIVLEKQVDDYIKSKK
ncbi:DUF885 domain-containing protein [Alkaliphilus serpentinus]|uniref:DUF885 domain-containing protein n=1 Tax=Alkaliphilus serpentinus TaxID=1482731 RepID=UPI00242B4742|nr:DUF885 domain-containing protein [Alkaliphilus serpentinus]